MRSRSFSWRSRAISEAWSAGIGAACVVGRHAADAGSCRNLSTQRRSTESRRPSSLATDVIEPAVLHTLPGRLRDAQRVFDATGGLHAAGLFTASGELQVLREDIGRHNAVDKVVGARVLAGEAPAAACLVLSGRVGFELVQKAAASGIGSIVAVGAPTSLAARLAGDAGIDLWGFTSPGRTVRYC